MKTTIEVNDGAYMKISNGRNDVAGLKKLGVPRARFSGRRWSRRRRLPAPPPVVSTDEQLPIPAAAIGTEVISSESMHGNTLQLYLREIGRVLAGS